VPKAHEAAPTDDAVIEAVLRRIADDVSHAGYVEADAPDHARLRGLASLDEQHARRHLPVEVVYALREIDGRRWLVRTQRPLDAPTGARQRVDLVARGVVSFRLVGETFHTPDPALSVETPVPRQPAQAGERRAPDGGKDDTPSSPSPTSEAANTRAEEATPRAEDARVPGHAQTLWRIELTTRDARTVIRPLAIRGGEG